MTRSSFSDARRLAAIAVCSLALVAGAVGCSSDDEADTASTGTTGTAPAVDAGQEVERFIAPTEPVDVAVGQEFEIELEADTADCYSWSLAMPTTDVVTLSTDGADQVTDPNEENLSSGSSQDVFLFTAEKAGTVELPFTQTSPCPDSPPIDPLTVTVNVG